MLVAMMRTSSPETFININSHSKKCGFLGKMTDSRSKAEKFKVSPGQVGILLKTQVHLKALQVVKYRITEYQKEKQRLSVKHHLHKTFMSIMSLKKKDEMKRQTLPYSRMPDNNLGGGYVGVHCTAFQLFMFKSTGGENNQ